MITIVDYGMGNLGSVANMFKKVGAPAIISSDPDVIMKADKLLLPGVGSFDRAMEQIRNLGLREILDYKALQEKVPILGICLGMQLLTNRSEEGALPGFGWIPGETLGFKFSLGQNLKIPHMGWNQVKLAKESPLVKDFPLESRFYFVHSYYVKVADESHSIMKTTYGHEFDSGLQNENIFGAQFHPEKSHRFGMKLLENFAKL